jgi:GDP/UDP-N,N'-diacetylbacillosamine 2-epimerase (hydrolysing)
MNKMSVLVVTGSRADFGLLHNLIAKMNREPALRVQLMITGAHSSKFGGNSIEEVMESGFTVDWQMKIFDSGDNPEDIVQITSNVITDTAKALLKLKPQIVLILGDRYEIFGVATAAYLMGIQIAHLHGGEVTEGSLDDGLRHAISKLSTLHFVSTEASKNRLLQMGESSDSVYVVGGLGAEKISHVDLMTRRKVEEKLNWNFGRQNLLVTYHPHSSSLEKTEKGIFHLLSALSYFKDINYIFTSPNADSFGSVILEEIKFFLKDNSRSVLISNMGSDLYLSCVNYVDGVIGNSSSGVLEVPSFKKGTINLGDRQSGRVTADSVINCNEDSAEIIESIRKLYSDDFQKDLVKSVNPYFLDGTTDRIINVLTNFHHDSFSPKHFVDLKGWPTK